MGELRAAALTAIHVVVPDGIDDPARPSGGNVYDRRLCRGLTAIGWSVHEHAVPGSWPRPAAASYAALAGVLRRVPDDAVVLLDGLVASAAPEALVPQASRLRLVVLVHMPLGHRPPAAAGDATRTAERAVLSAAAAVVTTSAWTRRRLLELYPLAAARVHVAEPGVDAAALAPGTAAAGALLCVAAVTFDKGHDVLLDALETTADLAWHCVCVGSLERDPAFVASLRQRAQDGGLGDRVCFPGPRVGADLDRSYAAADLLVLASRAETYGMVVSEALARGLPVVAAEVGGVAEALGHGADGTRPGLLVPPDDRAALGAALRAWLVDDELEGGCARPPASGARRSRRGRPPRPSSPASWPGCRDDRGGHPGQRGLARPPRARRRRGPCARSRRGARATPPGERPPGDPRPRGRLRGDGPLAGAALPGPQHWVVHDRDADLLAVAVGDPPGPAADGAEVTVEARQSDITRLRPGDLANATLVTASALLDMLTGDELAGLVAVCGGAGCPVLGRCRSWVASS